MQIYQGNFVADIEAIRNKRTPQTTDFRIRVSQLRPVELLITDSIATDACAARERAEAKLRELLSCEAWTNHASVYDGDAGIGAFQTWISGTTPIDTPSAIVMISHQKNNKMFFNDNTETPWIDSDHVLRRFAAPSLAILGACGAAGPGQSDFVRQFNLRGVATVVATTYEVDARMAGMFIAALMQNLSDNRSKSEYTISNAVSDAMRSVSTTAQDASQRVYGPRAFAFIAAGNSQLRVCVPSSSSGPIAVPHTSSQ